MAAAPADRYHPRRSRSLHLLPCRYPKRRLRRAHVSAGQGERGGGNGCGWKDTRLAGASESRISSQPGFASPSNRSALTLRSPCLDGWFIIAPRVLLHPILLASSPPFPCPTNSLTRSRLSPTSPISIIHLHFNLLSDTYSCLLPSLRSRCSLTPHPPPPHKSSSRSLPLTPLYTFDPHIRT